MNVLKMMNVFKMIFSFSIINKLILKIIIFISLHYMVYFLKQSILKNISKNIFKTKEKDDLTDYNTYAITINIFYYMIALYITLYFLGISKNSVFTYFSGFSLVIVYVIRDHISNLFSGLVILYKKSVKVDDYIELDKNNKGYIYKIDLLRTSIYTIDNKEISITNGMLMRNIYKRIPQSDFVFLNISFDIPRTYNYFEFKKDIKDILDVFKEDGIIFRANNDLVLESKKFTIENYEVLEEEDGLNKIIIKNNTKLDTIKLSNGDINKLFKFNTGNDYKIARLVEISNNEYIFKSTSSWIMWEDILYIDESSINKYNHIKITVISESSIHDVIPEERKEITIKNINQNQITVEILLKCPIRKKYDVYDEFTERINQKFINKDKIPVFNLLDDTSTSSSSKPQNKKL